MMQLSAKSFDNVIDAPHKNVILLLYSSGQSSLTKLIHEEFERASDRLSTRGDHHHHFSFAMIDVDQNAQAVMERLGATFTPQIFFLCEKHVTPYPSMQPIRSDTIVRIADEISSRTLRVLIGDNLNGELGQGFVSKTAYAWYASCRSDCLCVLLTCDSRSSGTAECIIMSSKLAVIAHSFRLDCQQGYGCIRFGVAGPTATDDVLKAAGSTLSNAVGLYAMQPYANDEGKSGMGVKVVYHAIKNGSNFTRDLEDWLSFIDVVQPAQVTSVSKLVPSQLPLLVAVSAQHDANVGRFLSDTLQSIRTSKARDYSSISVSLMSLFNNVYAANVKCTGSPDAMLSDQCRIVQTQSFNTTVAVALIVDKVRPMIFIIMYRDV